VLPAQKTRVMLENPLRPLAAVGRDDADQDGTPPGTRNALVEFAELERARAYERASLAPATLRAYAQSWRDFEAWCVLRGVDALPARPDDVGRYLAELADRGRKVGTIRRQVAAISRAHDAADVADPTASSRVRQIVAGIARTHGAPPKKKDALTLDRLRAVLAQLEDESLRTLRDRALLLIGFAAALRRSELVALNVADLRWETSGVVLTIRRSKTDREGKGREIGVPRLDDETLCPVRALRAWLDIAQIAEGPVFRSFALPSGRRALGAITTERLRANAVALVVQRAVGAADLSGDFAAHSLRAGFITAAAAANVSEIEIARVSGHRSADVLRGYVRRASVLDAPALQTIIARS